MVRRVLIVIVCLATGGCGRQPQTTPPARRIIDMHGHAYPAGHALGGPREASLAPPGPDSLIQRALAELDRHGVELYLASGPMEDAGRWHAAAPDRIRVGVMFPCPGGRVAGVRCFETGAEWPDITWLRREIESGRVHFLGEILGVYAGVSLADPRFEPYYALATELRIPIGVHSGAGPRRPPGDCRCPNFNHEFGNPALLETVLTRYPTLRLFLMHAGGPRFLDQTIALMIRHQSVYADISAISVAWPQEEFEQWLRAFVDAGLELRVMFGSDAVFSLDESLKVLDRVPFLTRDQKDAILYTNAARFLEVAGKR